MREAQFCELNCCHLIFIQGHYGEARMGVIKHEDGTEETVAVKTLKNCLINSPESTDLQRECFIMKVIIWPTEGVQSFKLETDYPLSRA